MGWRRVDERDAEIVASAATGAVIFGRDDLIALVATGKHRTRFLHAISTQDVNDMAPGARRRNCLCTAKGALVGWWWQVTEVDRDVLWTPRAGADALCEALLGYRVAERVKLAATEELALVEVVGPAAMTVADAVSLTLPAVGTATTPWQRHTLRIWQTAAEPAGDGTPARPMSWSAQVPREALGPLASALIAAGAQPGCHAAREVLRVRAGEPNLRDDLPADSGTTPLEFGLADAVSLDKGCYLGHEALAVQSWRGQLRRHLTWLTADIPVSSPDNPVAPGTKLRTAAGKRAGWMGGGYVLPDGERLGLGLVQRRAFAIGATLTTDPGSAAVTLIQTTTPGIFAP